MQQRLFPFMRNLPRQPIRPDRLFFCLFPDPETSARVSRLAENFLRENHPWDRQLRADRFHISLHHVGDYKRLRSKHIYAAEQAGDAVSARSFEVTCRSLRRLKSVLSTQGARRKRALALIAEGEGLAELHRVLGAAMKKTGFRVSDHFLPHMTLSYGQEQTPDQAIEPIRFKVSSFSLVHSRLWLSQYDVKARWPLLNSVSVDRLPERYSVLQ